MATARNVLDGLVAQLSPLFAGFSPAVDIAVGWPPLDVLQTIPQGGHSIISVYDGDGTRNSTRWAGQSIGSLDATTVAGVAVTFGPKAIVPSGTTTLTLSGIPAINDTVAFLAQAGSTTPLTAYHTAATSESLATFVAALATAINAVTGLAASVVGSTIVVTNNTSSSLSVQCGAANTAQRNWEYSRVERHVRVIAWTATEDIRQTVTDPIDAQLAKLESSYGYHLVNGEGVRLLKHGDAYVEEAQLKGVYRRDFRMSLEYGTTQLETLYPVIATALTYAVKTS